MVKHYPVDLQNDGSITIPCEVREYLMNKKDKCQLCRKLCRIYTIPRTSQGGSRHLLCLREEDDIEKLIARITDMSWSRFGNNYVDKSTGRAIIYSRVAAIIRPEIRVANYDNGKFNLSGICESAGLSGKLTWVIPDEAQVPGIINPWLELWPYDNFRKENEDVLLSLNDPRTKQRIYLIFNGFA